MTEELSGADPADVVTVRALLSAAGIPASEDEVQLFAAGYPRLRAMVALLHAVPEARYEAPGLRFDPAQATADWGTGSEGGAPD